MVYLLESTKRTYPFFHRSHSFQPSKACGSSQKPTWNHAPRTSNRLHSSMIVLRQKPILTEYKWLCDNAHNTHIRFTSHTSQGNLDLTLCVQRNMLAKFVKNASAKDCLSVERESRFCDHFVFFFSFFGFYCERVTLSFGSFYDPLSSNACIVAGSNVWAQCTRQIHLKES